MRLRILLALLVLLPLPAAALDGPRGVDLSTAPPGVALATGLPVDGLCDARPIEAFLPPGGAALLGLTPDCSVVPTLSCTPEDRSPSCVDLRLRGLPSRPDAAGLAACVRASLACGLAVPQPDVSAELAPIGGGGPNVACANYARHAFVDTGETEVRVDLVWEAGCGSDAVAYHGLGQCLVKGVGPQPGSWVQDGCPHVHQWSGWEVAHEVTGLWHYQRPNGVQDGHHANRAGVHGDNGGGSWCEFTLEFNPHSSFLLAACGVGPF